MRIITVVGVVLLVLLVVSIGGCVMVKENTDYSKYNSAYFAGGCFWCMEHAFESLDGVKEVISGYMGGEVEYPSYEEVSKGTTGHRETVRVIYDPSEISYEQLLEFFWRNVDPFDAEGQFADKGPQYTTAIFYSTEGEKELAEELKEKVSERSEEPIATEIVPAEEFYEAEEHHQDYYKKNSLKFNLYKKGSGRENRLREIWNETENFSEKEDLRKKLTPLQYQVTQEGGTEPPFENEYWNNTEEGIYVDVVSGEPLFSSKDKFKSGTGWPSFTRPLVPENIVEKKELLGLGRTEVRSKEADSHLGHLFNDGPEPTGLRYCINSAALRFIPKEDLEQEGYGEYTRLFD